MCGALRRVTEAATTPLHSQSSSFFFFLFFFYFFFLSLFVLASRLFVFRTATRQGWNTIWKSTPSCMHHLSALKRRCGLHRRSRFCLSLSVSACLALGTLSILFLLPGWALFTLLTVWFLVFDMHVLVKRGRCKAESLRTDKDVLFCMRVWR